MKKEAKAQIEWNKYLRTMREQGMPFYGIFELKYADSDRIPFKCMEDGQKAGLPIAKKEGIIFKWSDADPRLKPFDCISSPPLPAYLVVRFSKCFVVIDIDEFLYAEKVSEASSLTLNEAREIATKVIMV